MAYRQTTAGVTVTVVPHYLDDQSRPDEDHYVWAYHVTIGNGRQDDVQLLRRHWRIVDGRGRMQEVRGAGVVGEQPVLTPGRSFEYTSGCPLSTPSGMMGGTYQMITEGGELFDVVIPSFPLDSPYAHSSVH